MSIFKQINEKIKQPQVADLIQTLNKYRLELTNEFTSNQQIPNQKILEMLLQLQMNIYQYQYTFDLRKLDQENLINIMKLFKARQSQTIKNKKYNVQWKYASQKYENKQERKLNQNQNKKQFNQQRKYQKQQVHLETKFCEETQTNKSIIPPIVPKKGFFFQTSKQQKKNQIKLGNESKLKNEEKIGNYAKMGNNQRLIQNQKLGNQEKYFINQNNKQVQKFDCSRTNQKSSSIEFVSASVLPKAVSLRKKFVPPFKKQQTQQSIKEEQGQDQEDQKFKDPLYKGLQKKLVEIIQCQILQTTKSVKWEQIAGLNFAKKLINQMIVWPMLRPDIFTGMRSPPRGILLFGPPGTGKTMIGRAIASSAHATFFNISASSLTSKWVGESQKLVRTLFQIARIKQPSVIFIDQIDSLLCSRSQGQQQSSRRVKTQFLVELDGTKTGENQRILIIGATNLPQQLDDAVRRRFIKRLYIPLPNLLSRKQLLQNLTNNCQFLIKKDQIEQVAKLTAGFSGADIHSLCKQASMMPLRQIHEIETIRFSEVPTAKLKHFKEALRFVRPSVNKKVLSKYQDWNQQYGSYQFNPDEFDSQTLNRIQS